MPHDSDFADLGKRPVKIIDTRLPLTWLLSTAGVLIAALVSVEWSISVQNNKLEELVRQYAKIEARLDQRDQRIDDLVSKFYEMERVDDAQSIRIQNLEDRVNGVRPSK